jgi:hypothetical protein
MPGVYVSSHITDLTTCVQVIDVRAVRSTDSTAMNAISRGLTQCLHSTSRERIEASETEAFRKSQLSWLAANAWPGPVTGRVGQRQKRRPARSTSLLASSSDIFQVCA